MKSLMLALVLLVSSSSAVKLWGADEEMNNNNDRCMCPPKEKLDKYTMATMFCGKDGSPGCRQDSLYNCDFNGNANLQQDCPKQGFICITSCVNGAYCVARCQKDYSKLVVETQKETVKEVQKESGKETTKEFQKEYQKEVSKQSTRSQHQ